MAGRNEFYSTGPNRAELRRVLRRDETDTRRVSGKRRDPDKVLRTLRSFARNISTDAGIPTLLKDIGTHCNYRKQICPWHYLPFEIFGMYGLLHQEEHKHIWILQNLKNI